MRSFPGRRRHPYFARDALAETLPEHGIVYQWFPQLGGRRKVQPGSLNNAWRNASFQAYADHLASAEFAEGLAELLTLATRKRTALMCAEAVWWRLPSFADCRRAEAERDRGDPHHRCHAQYGASVYLGGTHCGWAVELCVAARRVVAVGARPVRECSWR
ncbi:DUF488 domain-containing protein [Rhodanobacter umsongensis]